MNKTQKTLLVPMMIMIGMFSVLGFAVGIDAFFIPFVKKAFGISNTMSYLVLTATYSSGVIFSVPSGVLIKRVGYKGGMVSAFGLLAVSFFLVGLAANMHNYPLFLGALFVNGMGRVLLNAAVNPYITILGPTESAAKRISIMGISNKISYAVASLILAMFLNLSDVRMEDTTVPFYIIAAIVLVMGLASFFAPLPDIKAEGEDAGADETVSKNVAVANSKKSILQLPHLVLGVLAYFFYTGVEVTALSSINHYASELGLSNPQNYVWYASGSMIIGYILGVILIPKRLSQIMALRLSAALGIVLCIVILLVPSNISIYFVALFGLANALILPAIWPLSLADLGKFTKLGSGLLVRGGLGGGIIPLVYGIMVDAISSSQLAYIVCLLPYVFILYFGLHGYKLRAK